MANPISDKIQQTNAENQQPHQAQQQTAEQDAQKDTKQELSAMPGADKMAALQEKAAKAMAGGITKGGIPGGNLAGGGQESSPQQAGQPTAGQPAKNNGEAPDRTTEIMVQDAMRENGVAPALVNREGMSDFDRKSLRMAARGEDGKREKQELNDGFGSHRLNEQNPKMKDSLDQAKSGGKLDSLRGASGGQDVSNGALFSQISPTATPAAARGQSAGVGM